MRQDAGEERGGGFTRRPFAVRVSLCIYSLFVLLSLPRVGGKGQELKLRERSVRRRPEPARS